MLIDDLSTTLAEEMRRRGDDAWSPSVVTKAAGETVIRAQEQGENMFVIQAGEAEILNDGVVLDVVGPGGVVGEMALVDVLGRVGGEEFALLLPETVLAAGADIAERIRKRIAGQVFAWGGKNFGLTTSLGVAAWDPAEPTIDPALARADKGLYAAKDQGRNHVVTHGD